MATILPDYSDFGSLIDDAYFLLKAGATDSASAATAIATGYKTDDGNIAWLSGDPANGSLTTIAEQLRTDMGFSIGVVSTVPFNHATPAAFVSHNVSRNNYQAIAEEILWTVQPDVVIGGGYGTSYVNGLNFNTLPSDYVFVQRQAGVDGGDSLYQAATSVDLSAGEKLFGLFGGAGGNFDYHVVSDTPGSPSVAQGSIENPTLADTVVSTLSVLNQDPDGLFVMFEQGDIDWSNHANDFENMIGGMWDLDQAVRTAEAYVNRSGDDMTWQNTLIIVTADHSNSYMRNETVLGAGDLPTQVAASGSNAYGSGWSYPGGEVSYRSGGHTNELVTLSARGAGAELFEDYAGSWYPGTDIVDNSQIYTIMQDAVAAGVEHVMLFIGDGMNISHETAASRYLYGRDQALAWQQWDNRSNGWEGYASTWDVTTYNRYASANGLPVYDPNTFDPLVGYDPELGGEVAPQRADNIIQGNGTLTGSSKSEMLLGGNGGDSLNAGGGKDILAGSGGNDLMSAGAGNDLLLGGAGIDTLNGDGGDDQLFGEAGNDFLYGGNGEDILVGGVGDDLLNGGKGEDQLAGEAGADTFVLVRKNDTDTILDFEIGVDRMGLSGGLAFQNLSIRQGTGSKADDALIRVAGTGEVLAILTDTQANLITSASFVPVA